MAKKGSDVQVVLGLEAGAEATLDSEILALISKLEKSGNYKIKIGAGLQDLKKLPTAKGLESRIEALKKLEKIDLTKLNKLNINKSGLDHLAQYLPQFATSKVMDSLERLQNIKLDNLQNLTISKGTLQGLADLAAALSNVGQLKGKNTDAFSDTKVEKLAKTIDSVESKIASLGKKGVNTSVLSSGLEDARQKMEAFRNATDARSQQLSTSLKPICPLWMGPVRFSQRWTGASKRWVTIFRSLVLETTPNSFEMILRRSIKELNNLRPM